MKNFAKIFLILVWLCAIIGAGFGWMRFAKSGSQMLATMKALSAARAARRGQFAVQMAESDLVPETELEPGLEQEPEAEIPQAQPPTRANDFSCIGSMMQLAQDTAAQYLAEKGNPTERVDLKTQYKKTPAELKTDSFSGGTCSAQYLYCDANSCGYAISYMQSRGRTSTMAASVMGMHFSNAPEDEWNLSCFDLTELGKKICASYK